jgi:hypothetical protein
MRRPVSYLTTITIYILLLAPSEIFLVKSRHSSVPISCRNTSLVVGCGSAKKKTEHSVGRSEGQFFRRMISQSPIQAPYLDPLLMLNLDVMATLLAWTVSSMGIKGPYLSDRRHALLSWSADWAQCISDLRKTQFCFANITLYNLRDLRFAEQCWWGIHILRDLTFYRWLSACWRFEEKFCLFPQE